MAGKMRIPDDDTIRRDFQLIGVGGVDEGEEKPCDRCGKPLRIGDRVFGWSRKKASYATLPPLGVEVCTACNAELEAQS